MPRFQSVRGRARSTSRAVAAITLAGVTGLVTVLAPGAGAAPVQRPDPIATLAGAWQQARVELALARFGLGDAEHDQAAHAAVYAALVSGQNATRVARRMDPGSGLPGSDHLTAAIALARARRDLDATEVRSRTLAVLAIGMRANTIEDLLAYEVAHRGGADPARLRAEWDRAPQRSVGVMAFALAQVGKPYVFAAAGPATYDCSGLTMAAWARAGVKLVHFAATQYRQTERVAIAQLGPADLVFFKPDLGHVGMYVGQNLMVNAPRTGDVVRIAPITGRGPVRTGRVHG